MQGLFFGGFSSHAPLQASPALLQASPPEVQRKPLGLSAHSPCITAVLAMSFSGVPCSCLASASLHSALSLRAIRFHPCRMCTWSEQMRSDKERMVREYFLPSPDSGLPSI